jgi:hypothetical protein
VVDLLIRKHVAHVTLSFPQEASGRQGQMTVTEYWGSGRTGFVSPIVRKAVFSCQPCCEACDAERRPSEARLNKFVGFGPSEGAVEKVGVT